MLGRVLRFHRLCSNPNGADEKVLEFHSRLRARGHPPDALKVLFNRAEENATTYLARTPSEHEARLAAKQEEGYRSVHFHLQY